MPPWGETTEAALTDDLSEDLREAWERIRETAVEFGEQRIYASHHSIMFSKQVCYFFVRPKTKYLEVWIMLARAIKAPQVKSVMRGTAKSKKYANQVRITHRDEVEAPITDWLREAYDQHDALRATRVRSATLSGSPVNRTKVSPPRRSPTRRRARAKRRA